MAIKVEQQTVRALPAKTLPTIENIFAYLPKEHTRGISYLRLVDAIDEPLLRNQLAGNKKLPGLYHPRQQAKMAWLEIAIPALIQTEGNRLQRLISKFSFKNNLAYLLISLVAQHYHLTLRHSLKRSQLEGSIKAYTERYARLWLESQNTRRARLFKPLQPYFEKWNRGLQKKMKQNKAS